MPSMAAAFLLLLFLQPLAIATDVPALLSFKSLLSPAAALSSWSSNSSNPCSWLYVSCNPSNQVTSLNLTSLGLSGPISPSLFLLPHLVGIDLSFNSLSGPIPNTFTNLSSIQNLTLSSNSLTGPIPSSLSLLPSLTFLRLDGNLLTGTIPDSLSLLPLTYLSLQHNNLTGPIPSWLGRSSILKRLSLATNFLSGTIPSTFCTNPSALFSFDLSENNLVGSVPPTLGNCSSLSYFMLAQNYLSGTVPSILGSLPLKTLDLSFNNLSGLVPPSIYNVSSMVYLTMGMNQLEGTLPADIGLAMPELQALNLHGNRLHGRLPGSLANGTGLYLIDFSDNSFSGEIDVRLGGLQKLFFLSFATNRLESGVWGFMESLVNCSRLRFLILSQNRIQGKIPASVGNLSRTMEWVEMDENQMTGTIPLEIGNLFNLTLLDLSDNHLSGEIPTNIGKLNLLQVLNLSYNGFTGQIPSSISKLTFLSELYLSSNSLNGSIPPSLGLNRNLGTLNLSYNHLDSTIPKEIVSISSLTKALDLSHNSLSGPIPPEVKTLTNLVWLDLSHNKLSGPIPSSLGSCDELEYLNMQSNNLSGSIPETLSVLNLNHLDLSFNNLDGEVPMKGVFSNASAVFVSGNNLCGGKPALHLPSCQIVKHKHHRSHISKLIMINVICIALLLSLALALTLALCLKRRRRSKLATSKSLRQPKSNENNKYIMVSYNELYKATDGFSPEALIGTGSFGSVYRARITGYDKDVAVKVLKLDQQGAMKSFTAECEALRSVRHRNLVKIVTSCSTIDARGGDFRALVFDFMPNGSLDDWLHGGRRRLSLKERLAVAIDVGLAVEYLHVQGETPIVHCDLKPSNVLLDEDMNAHVGDFGLARFLSEGVKVPIQGFSDSAVVKGSIGYVAPEYGMGDRLSTRGDVYSYGILLLEMLTGRRPTDPMLEEGMVLRQFVEAAYPERVMEIVDRTLLPWSNDGDIDSVLDGSSVIDSVLDGSSVIVRVEQCLISILRIGLLCSKETASERMEMRDVLVEMQAIRATYLEGF